MSSEGDPSVRKATMFAAIEAAERVVGRDEGRVGERVIGGFEAGALL